MKRLYLTRHAKSSWKYPDLDDFDRPLNKRGKKDAPRIYNSFNIRNLKIDSIISSPALRAKKTAQKISKNINIDKPIIYTKDLYDVTFIRLNKLQKNLRDSDDDVVIVGHNPELTVFACNFIDFSKNISTSGIVGIEFDCDRWSDIDFSNAKLMFFDYPKKCIKST